MIIIPNIKVWTNGFKSQIDTDSIFLILYLLSTCIGVIFTDVCVLGRV